MEQLREHCFVAPYYEDDISRLRELIGAKQMLFGSDFPHAEGLAEPIEYVEELKDFSAHEVRQVMRDNALGLVT